MPLERLEFMRSERAVRKSMDRCRRGQLHRCDGAGCASRIACWAGGALSLIDAAGKLNRKDPHSRAQVGALQAIAWV